MLLYTFNKKRKRKRLSIYQWMNIGKDNRNILDSQEKANTLKRRTWLINKARSDYLKLYKK